MAGEVKQAPRERSFSYAPARGKGLLFLFPVCAGLIALEIFLFLRFDIIIRLMRQSSSLTRMVSLAFPGSWSTKQKRHLLQHSRVPDISGVWT